MVKRNTVRLTESQLHQLVEEVTIKVLTEDMEDEGLGNFIQNAAYKVGKGIGNTYRGLKNMWNTDPSVYKNGGSQQTQGGNTPQQTQSTQQGRTQQPTTQNPQQTQGGNSNAAISGNTATNQQTQSGNTQTTSTENWEQKYQQLAVQYKKIQKTNKTLRANNKQLKQQIQNLNDEIGNLKNNFGNGEDGQIANLYGTPAKKHKK